MPYLLDSLQSYESGHGDALNPHRLEMDKSFKGDYEVLKAPTVGEFRTLSDKILTKLENFSTQIHCTHLPPAHGTTTAGSMAEAFNLMSLLPVTALSTSNPSPLIPVQPTIWSQPSPHHHPDPATQSDAATLPLPRISVPSVGKDAMAWLRAVDQWELGGPSVGLILLKNWPPQYYTGAMRLVTGTLYSNRKLLAMEYRWYVFFFFPHLTFFNVRLGSDDAVFMGTYPEHGNITQFWLRSGGIPVAHAVLVDINFNDILLYKITC
ncbi:hypothetical protein B0H14DRAFT_3587365 [Mycena olivaceomarginata]|nr:hypothetical protein B0H14DRAFT_3587365 [Mycena olivaceomarginata]